MPDERTGDVCFDGFSPRIGPADLGPTRSATASPSRPSEPSSVNCDSEAVRPVRSRRTARCQSDRRGDRRPSGPREGAVGGDPDAEAFARLTVDHSVTCSNEPAGQRVSHRGPGEPRLILTTERVDDPARRHSPLDCLSPVAFENRAPSAWDGVHQPAAGRAAKAVRLRSSLGCVRPGRQPRTAWSGLPCRIRAGHHPARRSPQSL